MRIARLFKLFFILDAIVNLTGELTNNLWLTSCSKPLLLPLLAIWFVLSWNENTLLRLRYLVLSGLLFSTAGDIFLMFTARNDSFFLLGLASFLLAHICYIAAFLSYPQAKNGLVTRQPLVALPFLLFLILYNGFLFPNIAADLRIPVIVYSLVIIMMAICALNLQRLVSVSAFQPLFGGALLFVTSDSLLALNKFYSATTIPLAGFFIMLTYIFGQYFIVTGSLRIIKQV